MHQQSTTGLFRPERLDVDAGLLRLTTTSGINFRSPATGGTNPNSLDNGLGVGVDATRPLRIEATVVQPALGSGQAEQPAVWFGPGQDDYVKVDLASSGSPVYHRPQLVWEVGGVPGELNLDDPSRNLSAQDVRLILETDPVTRKATGSFQVGTGARQLIGETPALPSTWFAASTAAQGSGFAGLFATHRFRDPALGPVTYRFADFAVTDRTAAAGAAPNMEVATDRVVLSDAVAASTGTTTKGITVRNTGASTLTLQPPTIADDPGELGDDAGQWSVANAQTTIAPGAEGRVNVTLAATSNGVKGAFATIRSDDPTARPRRSSSAASARRATTAGSTSPRSSACSTRGRCRSPPATPTRTRRTSTRRARSSGPRSRRRRSSRRARAT
jgi:hypothetical protein